ncbi:ABC transporter ATP-binding protein [Microbacterium nymphoidis]|uniref:ABC transporter ATP-binding protein n=1 Tax=Microbacterium nymphoidis TaxID=2898586 RepID=UPI001E2ABBF2|nr:ABC transporter ATP-binding protein [Microbacterium nymphoidis]MCD2498492.1 ABC transporter ATP-binding protein [Microbacterium nymphoidis]
MNDPSTTRQTPHRGREESFLGTLSGAGLRLAYDRREVSRDLDISIPPGKVTVIIGPNASGKSTVLRALARLLRPTDGRVVLDGKDVRAYAPKEFARRLGLLPQSSLAPVGITVTDLVGRGRFPHQQPLRPPTADDAEAVRRAMEATRVDTLADRPVEELSGGQRQRVWIAMLLAQRAPVMLLDEPTTYLDISHQLDVLELLRDLNAAERRTIVLVLHDLNQAIAYADELVVVHEGRVVAQGTPSEVMTTDLLRSVFSIDARIIYDAHLTHPVVLPLASIRPEN